MAQAISSEMEEIRRRYLGEPLADERPAAPAPAAAVVVDPRAAEELLEPRKQEDELDALPAVLMMGTGEYTTGFAAGKNPEDVSDKSTGVVALVMLDMRSRGKVGRIGMCGTNGTKLPAIRTHMKKALADMYQGIDPSVVETWPEDTVVDRESFKTAASAFRPGDCAIIFTPDDTHFAIAMECIQRGMHVMVTKPAVKTLEEHRALAAAAAEKGVLCCIEFHKRLDPIYADACDKIQALGAFSFFQAYMSQPKHQLDTFKAWAGISSDISYYLNSHHIDFHNWALQGSSRPVSVHALASDGVAVEKLGRDCEDTITLAVQWENLEDGSKGHATYTSSWVAPKSDVHSQQRWFYMGRKGETTVDQAHRGYSQATDENGFGSVNPMFWKTTPSKGKFKGQRCYGYISLEEFMDAAAEIRAGRAKASDYDHTLATMHTTVFVTAILEAGRHSLDNQGKPFGFTYNDLDGAKSVEPLGIVPLF